ncbi:MAG: glycolate oxidase subunit GlcE [Immundisolibacteraceae bacterium]|nr:glycolate oxidase subunit GlcE [Immundisolibacteraceae bacterium]
MSDISQQLVDQIADARDTGGRLAILGHNSKQGFRGQSAGERFSTCDHHGIIDYEPGDLVLTARSGTPLVEIEALLADHGQCLGFEPPRFQPLRFSATDPANLEEPLIQGLGTLGGVVASGVSGPRRPWVGAVRDFVLGVSMVNGLAQRLHFGGQLIKNVAGFDVPRLMSGSMGSLGLMLDISVRVLPIRPVDLTLQLEMSLAAAMKKMIELQRQPLPLSGLVYHQGILSVRLSGTEQGVASAESIIGGDHLVDGAQWWNGLRDHRWDYFLQPEPLWRLSLAAATPLPGFYKADADDDWLIDWGGAQRWYRGDVCSEQLHDYVAEHGGHMSCFRGPMADQELRLGDRNLLPLHQQIKTAFDPPNVFDGSRAKVA